MCLHTFSGFRFQCCHDPLPQTHCSHGWPYLFLPLISQNFRPDLLVPKYSCICVQHYSWHFSESIRYMHMVKYESYIIWKKNGFSVPATPAQTGMGELLLGF